MGLNEGIFYEDFHGNILEGESLSVDFMPGDAPTITHFNGYWINSFTGEREEKINYDLSQTPIESILPLSESVQKKFRKIVDSKLEKSLNQPLCTEDKYNGKEEKIFLPGHLAP